ncbi:MAG: PepSY-like domain-containing protein [Muribaculaceae bacterium]|nr:PepSY-like domain-containing protein [Muribaculaceae bacterium]
MKKILIALMLFIAAGISTACADTYAHDASVLPAAAQAVLKKNFKAEVTVVKIDKDFGMVKDYEVILNDGTEISFDSKGNWEEVEVGRNMNVPAAFLLQPMRNYLNANFKGVNVVGVDKKRRGYEVKLANGIELEFDTSGNFLRYDD